MRLTGNLFIDGPEGRLEAILKEPAEPVRRAAVICHPHPLYGGTMHNKVVYRIAKTFNEAGFAAFRFNFRGVGASAGVHDNGRGEQQDLSAAVDFIQRQYPESEIWLAGFSFGAVVTLNFGCYDDRAVALVVAGVPAAIYNNEGLRTCEKPKLLVHGSFDQFGPIDQLRRFFEALSRPKELAVVDGADHFFEGRLDELATAISGFIREQSAATP